MTPDANPIVESPRLILRRFRPSDVESFLRYRCDPDVARYQGWDAYTREEASAFIEDQSSRQMFQPGAWSQLAVALRRPSTHIGDCALRITGRDPRQAELGFTFAREYQGQGFATEATSHLLAFAFAKLGLHRVFAVTDDRNARAIALLERIKMRREGHFRENEWFKGEWVNNLLYAILDNEPHPPNQAG